MGLWKLKWAISTAIKPTNYKSIKREFSHVWKFYAGLVLKFKRSWYQADWILKHRSGQKFFIQEFMDLFKVQEIYAERCYDIELENYKNPTILDIGANKGFFAMRMKFLYPKARIVCAEPVADNLQELYKHLKLNNIDAEVCAYAVGFPERVEKIFLDPENSGAHSFFRVQKHLPFNWVQVISLERLFEQHHLNHCDLLKLDCEGSELEIIESLSPEMAAKIDNILFESTANDFFSPQLVVEKLEKLGFKVQPKGNLFWAERERVAQMSAKSA